MLEFGSGRVIMWEAIKYVSGGFTLCAFVVAVIARTYQKKNKAELEEIKSAPEQDRASIITAKIGAFAVETSNLTKEQQYDVVVRQINARIERYRLLATVVVLLAVVASGLSAYAYRQTSEKKTTESAQITPTIPQPIHTNTSADPANDAHSRNIVGNGDTAQAERFNQIAVKINESIRADRDSGDPNSLAGGCPAGARTEFSIVTGKVHYYSCAKACFATRDSVLLSDLDFEKMTILTIPQDPNWAWIKIPCLADKGKCIQDVMGTVGQGTASCNQPPKQQNVWVDELNVVSRTQNANTVFDYFKDLANPR